MYYDPMICKLTTFGKTRQEAIDTAVKALDHYVIRLKTILPHLKIVLDMFQAFIKKALDTNSDKLYNSHLYSVQITQPD